jgi:hypothetical protein
MDFKQQVNQVAVSKGEGAAKRAGQKYCEDWRREIDVAKKNLILQKNSLTTQEYNMKAVQLNKETADLAACITIYNKMLG